MKEINTEHTNKLYKQLGGDSGETTLLKNILRVDSSIINSEWFFDYFFISNFIIKKHQQKLTELILIDQNFHVVHGYAKNGKTTFIKNTIREFNKNGNLIEGYNHSNIKHIYTEYYDFQYLNNGDFIDKIKQLIKISIISYGTPDDQRKKNENIEKFHRTIRSFLNKILSPENDLIPQYDLVIKSIEFVEIKMKDFIFQTHDFLDSGDTERIGYYFNSFIAVDINKNNIEYFFIYKVLYDIFNQISNNVCNKESKSKIVFILDNIDEYLQDNDFLFLKHPQVMLWAFFKELFDIPIVSSYFYESVIENTEDIANEIKQITFDFKSQVCFVYVFRTANFLAFAHLMRELYVVTSETQASILPTAILGTNYIRYSTIECTSEIINQRLYRFFEIIGGGRISKPPKGFSFLKNMSELLNVSSDEDSIREKYRNIFNLWNGDKVKLFEYIIINWNFILIKYFQSEELVESVVSIKKKYLIKGVYIHFFLDLLHKDNVVLEDLLKHILFSFVDEANRGKNIRRIILNIITNVSEKNKRGILNSNSISTISNIPEKGIGLYDLLEKIQNYIDEINDKEYYDFENVKQFFKDICDAPRIDFFAQLISIYKSPKKSGEPENYSNYYNINKEIERFILDQDSCKDELNRIRVFNNNNAAYLTSSLLSNFEYFSFIIGKDFKPLIFSVTRKRGLSIVQDVKDFYFYDIIEAVFDKVKKSVDEMTDFYLEKLIKKYPPNIFITDEKFSIQMEIPDSNSNTLAGNFQIRMIIARHFTYLVDFRESILRKENLFMIQSDEKKLINNYLLNKLDNYNELYIQKYENILYVINEDKVKYSDKLNAHNLDADYGLRKIYRQNFIDIKENKLNPYVVLDDKIEVNKYENAAIICEI